MVTDALDTSKWDILQRDYKLECTGSFTSKLNFILQVSVNPPLITWVGTGSQGIKTAKGFPKLVIVVWLILAVISFTLLIANLIAIYPQNRKTVIWIDAGLFSILRRSGIFMG